MSIPKIIDPKHTVLAAELYNRIHLTLIEAGWKEKEDPEDEPSPGWWWRHPDHPGSFAMDAAYNTVIQARPKRG